jgi:hypothetical protein
MEEVDRPSSNSTQENIKRRRCLTPFDMTGKNKNRGDLSLRSR